MDAENKKFLKNGAKVLGEMILPGTSLLIEEKVPTGLLHVGAGVLARTVAGAPGMALVAANSLSLSMTGRNLLDVIRSGPEDDPRDPALAQRVEAEVARGTPFEILKADLLEDLEDLFEESKARWSKARSVPPAQDDDDPIVLPFRLSELASPPGTERSSVEPPSTTAFSSSPATVKDPESQP